MRITRLIKDTYHILSSFLKLKKKEGKDFYRLQKVRKLITDRIKDFTHLLRPQTQWNVLENKTVVPKWLSKDAL